MNLVISWKGSSTTWSCNNDSSRPRRVVESIRHPAWYFTVYTLPGVISEPVILIILYVCIRYGCQNTSSLMRINKNLVDGEYVHLEYSIFELD